MCSSGGLARRFAALFKLTHHMRTRGDIIAADVAGCYNRLMGANERARSLDPVHRCIVRCMLQIDIIYALNTQLKIVSLAIICPGRPKEHLMTVLVQNPQAVGVLRQVLKCRTVLFLSLLRFPDQTRYASSDRGWRARFPFLEIRKNSMVNIISPPSSYAPNANGFWQRLNIIPISLLGSGISCGSSQCRFLGQSFEGRTPLILDRARFQRSKHAT